MQYERASVSERRTMPPAVAVSTVAFALQPPADATVCSGVAYRDGFAVSDAVDAELGGVAAATAGSRQQAPTLWIPLVRRTRAPYLGLWALPGGPTEWDETLADTALRTLRDAVLRDPGYLEQLYSFGGVERSAEARRLVTIAYWALFGESDLQSEAIETHAIGPASGAPAALGARWDDPEPFAETTGELEATVSPGPDPNVAWYSADRLPELAFDHAEIIAYALSRLRTKTEYEAVAHRFLGAEFTLGQLRSVHEAVTGRQADPANFRRQMLAQGHLVDTGSYQTGTRHRPAKLYRFRDESSHTAAGLGETTSGRSMP